MSEREMAYMSSCYSHKCTMLHMTVFSSIHLSKVGHFIFNNINNQADGYIYHDLFKSDHIWVLANWNLPSYSSPLVLLERILPKTACGCPCGRVIRKTKNQSHIQFSHPMECVRQCTIHIPGDPRSVQLGNSNKCTEMLTIWQLYDYRNM